MHPLLPARAAGPDEILVTAQRRAERLGEVGAALSVLDAGDLEAQRIRSPQDLRTSLSNVEIAEPLGNAFSLFVVRGVGLNDFNTNNNPAVGIYRDDAYLSSNALVPRLLFDLDRIEVLKGPQGTLYGRNTTGGAVNLVSAGPGTAFAGHADLGYGNHATLEAQAAAGGPLGDKAGLRVAGFLRRAFGGPQFNRLTGRHHGEVRAAETRAVAVLDPAEALSLRLSLSAGRDRSDLLWFQHRGVLGPDCQVATRGIFDPSRCFDAFGYHDTDGDKLAGDYSRDPRLRDSHAGATLKADARLGDWTLTSITDVEGQRAINGKEEDASPQTVVEIDYDSRIRQTSEELRLASPSGGRFDWLLGGFAGRYRHRERRRADIADFERTYGPIFGSSLIDLPYRQATDTGAGFADLAWRPTETVKLEGGLRYSAERIAYRGGTRLPLLNVPLVQVDDRIHSGKLSWRANLSWRAAESLLLYGQVATGFKSGGFFGGFAFTPAELRPYRPETVRAYEIGVKGRPLAGLFLQAAGFVYDYDDLQAIAAGSIGAGGTLTTPTLRNLPGATLRGADLEAAWQAAPALQFRATLGLLHSRIRGPAFVLGSAGAAGPLFNVAGNSLPRAPRLSATLAADYREPLAAGLDFLGDVSLAWRSTQHLDLADLPMARQKGFATLGGRLGIASQDGRWEVTLWGRNLTNIIPYLADGPIGFGERDLVVYGAPRSYGIDLRTRF